MSERQPSRTRPSLAEDNPGAVGREAGASPESGATRLALADGNRLTVETLELALTSRGYDVTATVTERVALWRAVLVHRPDVCLLEPRLVDGFAVDVIDRARTRAPDVKFLVFSTDTSPALVAAVIEAGAVGCLSKNRSIDALARSVQRATRGEFVIDPAVAQATLQDLGRHRDDASNPLRWLTPRELEVLRRLTDGEGTREIARALGMSTNTARTHLQNVLDKLGVHSRLEAVAVANRAYRQYWSQPERGQRLLNR